MYACSPRWPGDWISEDDLSRCLTLLNGKIQPSPWGRDRIGVNEGLHFTGGEPFLNFPLLLQAVEMAEERSIPSTFVETNASWCRADDEARDKLSKLRDAGLKGILISVNPFYTEFIPFERTERCIQISLEVFGRNVAVYQLEHYERLRATAIRGTLPLAQYLQRYGTKSLARDVEMFLMGRAAIELRPYFPRYPAGHFFGEPCQTPFLRSWHNHFDNYGNFMPGFCGGISLGDWRDLARLTSDGFDPGRRPVLKYLAEEDVEGLCRFAEEYGYRQRADGYISKCDLCLDMRRYLIKVQDFAELRPREFYSELDRGCEGVG